MKNYLSEQEARRAILNVGKRIYDRGYVAANDGKYSLQGTTQGRYLTGGVPPVRFSM